MGFLDKAKAAATDLAAKADSALAGAGLGGPGAVQSSGEAERFLRDLGVLAYLEATGRGGSPADRDRILAALHDFETRGELHALSLSTAAPPAPGVAAAGPTAWAPPPAPGAAAPPPGAAAPPPGAQAPAEAPRPASPPPPSWASGGTTE